MIQAILLLQQNCNSESIERSENEKNYLRFAGNDSSPFDDCLHWQAGESAVYVPAGNAEWSLEEVGLINGAEPLDNMLGITLDGEHAKVMYELHSGYTDSEICVFDDGTMEIDGRVYSYACSDQSLTLMREGKSSVYSNYTFSLESSNNPAYASFLVDGNIINVSPDATVGRFIEKGFWTEVALDQLMASGKVTDGSYIPEESL